MANIHTDDYIYKFGRLIQFGTNFMIGFSTFADTFHTTRESYIDELNNYGYSNSWIDWQKQNAQNILDLYDALNAENLIPTSPSV